MIVVARSALSALPHVPTLRGCSSRLTAPGTRPHTRVPSLSGMDLTSLGWDASFAAAFAAYADAGARPGRVVRVDRAAGATSSPSRDRRW